MKAHEGFLDGVEGTIDNMRAIESILDSYVVDVEGVGTYGATLSNDDAAKVRELMCDVRRVVERIESYWMVTL